ncbi:helix-turn-helix transcriptional regulator [Streptomyces clavuligerus]|uniref:Response regulator n=1 Tax=Streptomyces clavuligerus TaxID=1901 RepID=E2Q4B6_STRCL|nr:helix-turn-helix transcriptional regulator [Streptomyces clavuligerus]EFG06954.1 Response regulator [Streptomyces clavuligerus]QPJ93122.1 response regulator transcription factor [Streptomyces clavuligerus]
MEAGGATAALRQDDASEQGGCVEDEEGDGAEGLRVLWLAHDEVSFHGLPILLARLTLVRLYRLCRTVEAFHGLLQEERFDICVVPSQSYSAPVATWVGQTGARLVLTSPHARRPSFGDTADGARGADAWLQEQRIDCHVIQRVLQQLVDANAGPDGAERSPHSSGTLLERGLNRVTQRERAVLSLLAQGLSNQQIARALGISIHGVKRHVSNLLIKLDSSNRTEVALKVTQLGLLPTYRN